LPPFNAEQKQFVEVFGNLREPTTDYEKVWRKYLKRKEIDAKSENQFYTGPELIQDSFSS
jgi:uncharacterized protein YifE (UPF0438 family)